MDLLSLPTEFFNRLVLLKSIVGKLDFEYMKNTVLLPVDVKQKLINLLKTMNSLNVTCKEFHFETHINDNNVHYSGFLNEHGTGLVPHLIDDKIAGAHILVNGKCVQYLLEGKISRSSMNECSRKEITLESLSTKMTFYLFGLKDPLISTWISINYEQQTKYCTLKYLGNEAFELIFEKRNSLLVIEWLGFEPKLKREEFNTLHPTDFFTEDDNKRNAFIRIDDVPQEITDNFIVFFNKINEFARKCYPEQNLFSEIDAKRDYLTLN